MIVFDAGALVGLDRGDRTLWSDLKAAALAGVDVAVPAAVVAQVWRGSARQARLSRALAGCEIASFDDVARAAGELCGRAGTSDVVDATVAVVAASSGANRLYTSDPADLRHLLQTHGARQVKVTRC